MVIYKTPFRTTSGPSFFEFACSMLGKGKPYSPNMVVKNGGLPRYNFENHLEQIPKSCGNATDLGTDRAKKNTIGVFVFGNETST